jgi:hypothetical protein
VGRIKMLSCLEAAEAAFPRSVANMRSDALSAILLRRSEDRPTLRGSSYSFTMTEDIFGFGNVGGGCFFCGC